MLNSPIETPAFSRWRGRGARALWPTLTTADSGAEETKRESSALSGVWMGQLPCCRRLRPRSPSTSDLQVRSRAGSRRVNTTAPAH